MQHESLERESSQFDYRLRRAAYLSREMWQLLGWRMVQ